MGRITKIQYRDFEPGEFTDRKDSTCEDTIRLIESFPWTTQREQLRVGPTGPSITIEGPNGDYLKLALYYNDKYILYYLNDKKQLYTHPIPTLPDAYPIIRSFFDNDHPDIAGFKLESTPFAHNDTHFETKLFNYTMKPFPTLISICLMSGLCILPSFILFWAILRPGLHSPVEKFFMGLVGVCFLTVGVLVIALFINHYRSAKDKILTISSGNDLFYFGHIGAPRAYNKKEIREVGRWGGYKGLDGLKRMEIVFKDGEWINISGLIINVYDLQKKIPDQTFIPKDGFSIMPSSASALF